MAQSFIISYDYKSGSHFVGQKKSVSYIDFSVFENEEVSKHGFMLDSVHEEAVLCHMLYSHIIKQFFT